MLALYRYILPHRQLNNVRLITTNNSKHGGGIRWTLPKLKNLSPEESQFYTMVKSKDFKTAYKIFTNLLQDKFKFSPKLFKLGVDLSVYIGNPISINELSSYIEDQSILPEPATLSFLLVDCVAKQNTEYLLQMLDTIFNKELPIRKHALTLAIEYLLTQTENYQIIADLVDRHIELNYQFENSLLDALCLQITKNQTNTILLETLKRILMSYHNEEQCINEGVALNQLISTLSKLNGREELVPVALKNGICMKCGKKLRELSLTDGEYDLLLSEVKRIMINQYINFQRTEKLKEELLSYKKALTYFTNKFPGNKALVVDGMNLSHIKKVGFTLDLLEHRIELVKRPLSITSAFVIIRYITRNNNEHFWRSLNKKNIVFATNFDSRDDLYCVYAVLEMKERGVLLTNDRFRELKNDIPLSIHPILDKWYYKHVINFSKEPFEFTLNKDLLVKAVEYERDGSIHIPLKDSGEWYCTRL